MNEYRSTNYKYFKVDLLIRCICVPFILLFTLYHSIEIKNYFHKWLLHNCTFPFLSLDLFFVNLSSTTPQAKRGELYFTSQIRFIRIKISISYNHIFLNKKYSRNNISYILLFKQIKYKWFWACIIKNIYW